LGECAQLAAIVFFALGLALELVAYFIENPKYHRSLELVGIIFFCVCAAAEYFAYKYDMRREVLEENQHKSDIVAAN